MMGIPDADMSWGHYFHLLFSHLYLAFFGGSDQEGGLYHDLFFLLVNPWRTYLAEQSRPR